MLASRANAYAVPEKTGFSVNSIVISAGYMYQRQRSTAGGFTTGTKLSEFIPEERNYTEPNDVDYKDEQMFDMDVDVGRVFSLPSLGWMG